MKLNKDTSRRRERESEREIGSQSRKTATKALENKTLTILSEVPDGTERGEKEGGREKRNNGVGSSGERNNTNNNKETGRKPEESKGEGGEEERNVLAPTKEEKERKRRVKDKDKVKRKGREETANEPSVSL